MSSVVSDIVNQRRERQVEAESSEDRCYSVVADGSEKPQFLDLRLRGGHRTAFAYSDLLWVNYDSDGSTLDLDFNGILVRIRGSGLAPRLYEAIISRSVEWLIESGTELVTGVSCEPVTIEHIGISAGEIK